jgi:hypothetical protein
MMMDMQAQQEQEETRNRAVAAEEQEEQGEEERDLDDCRVNCSRRCNHICNTAKSLSPRT